MQKKLFYLCVQLLPMLLYLYTGKVFVCTAPALPEATANIGEVYPALVLRSTLIFTCQHVNMSTCQFVNISTCQQVNLIFFTGQNQWLSAYYLLSVT